MYSVFSKEDLLRVLCETKEAGGILMADLKESFPGVEAVVCVIPCLFVIISI